MAGSVYIYLVMKQGYKPFLILLIVLAAGLCAGLPARAQDQSAFTVAGVRADASAQSATKARESAFAQAQTAAFTTLAARLVPAQDLGRLKTPDAATIATLIQDFEITNERLSSVRYIGTYTFRFDPVAVQTFLAGRGLTRIENPVVPDAPPSVSGLTLVLPFLEDSGRTVLWTEDNPWRQAWQAGARAPIVLPAGDVDDMRAIPDGAAMTYDPAALKEMTARYGAARAVVALARRLPDPRQPSATGSMEVSLYRAEASGPHWIRTVSVPAASGVDLYAQGVRDVSAALTDSSAGASASVARSPLTLYLAFSGPDEWMATHRALESFSGLSGLEIVSLTPRRAVLRAAFAGDEPTFLAQSHTQGLSVSPAGTGPSYTVCLEAYCAPSGVVQ
jgi:hypothetical protein